MMTTEIDKTRARKPPEAPVGQARVRTCAGCGAKDSASAFVRVVLGPATEQAREVVMDVGGSSFGRGAHVHARPDCLIKACKSGFARAFKAKIAADAKVLAAQLVAGIERRMTGMLVAARRAGYLAVGADAACEALEQGAPLVIVAQDAGSVVGRGPVASAIAGGRAIAWGSKVSLGRLLGRDEVAVVAVWNAPLASELAGVFVHADACRVLSVESTSEAR